MSSTAIVGGRGFRIDARQTSGEAHLEDAKDRRQSSGGMANELVGSTVDYENRQDNFQITVSFFSV